MNELALIFAKLGIDTNYLTHKAIAIAPDDTLIRGVAHLDFCVTNFISG